MLSMRPVLGRNPVAALIAATATLSMTGVAVPATASGDSTETAASLIADVSPDQGDPVDAPVVAGEISVESDLGSVIVPVDPDLPIVIESETTSGPALEVSLPAEVDITTAEIAGDGTIVYEADDDGTAVAVQVMDEASVRIQTIIPDAAAPTEYTYDLGLPTDVVPVTNPDSSIDFANPDGEWIAGVAAPWAKDANGADVPTHYRVDGTDLVQVVDLSGVDAFPVVADPYLGKALISKVVYSLRDSRGTTVMVTPTAWGRANGNNPTAVNALRNEYIAKVSGPYETSQMLWQLACHAQIVPLKSTWNLDSWIKRSSYWQYITNGCN